MTTDEDVTTLTLLSVDVLKNIAAGLVLGGDCVVGAVLNIPEGKNTTQTRVTVGIRDKTGMNIANNIFYDNINIKELSKYFINRVIKTQ